MTIKKRIDALERSVPVPGDHPAPRVDLSRLTDAELDELEGYRERIRAARPVTEAAMVALFTPNEIERIADLREKVTA